MLPPSAIKLDIPSSPTLPTLQRLKKRVREASIFSGIFYTLLSTAVTKTGSLISKHSKGPVSPGYLVCTHMHAPTCMICQANKMLKCGRGDIYTLVKTIFKKNSGENPSSYICFLIITVSLKLPLTSLNLLWEIINCAHLFSAFLFLFSSV